MSVEPIHDEGQQLPAPTGKVLGVVDSQEDLDRVADALKAAGFESIVSLHGQEGLQLLERVATFFWGDCESEVLKRHIDNLKQGRFVIGIETPAKRSQEAAAIASEQGAHFLVHMGLATVTWMKA
ncbi:hypothetical protein Mal4_20170 [Maioricimonas rarisocia]|uniref:PTS EIIA type-1 domain-containing protein n=1 Tax=Maioricimonas rarisocia TaxID=2528026 RepID=A0A517Z5H7_9PLAN|nr:hypothetical protein [Maioricimonas rarisocia]QDU37701.1 hypothetical protein Mal4_20170 [Maioricimonas rarisocia]